MQHLLSNVRGLDLQEGEDVEVEVKGKRRRAEGK